MASNELVNLAGDFIDFSNDGQHLIVQTGYDRVIIFYDFDGNPKNDKFEGLFGEFHPQKELLVTTFEDMGISHFYDYSGNLLGEFPGSVFDFQEQFWHEFSGYRDKALGFNTDGNYLLTLDKNGNLHLWKLDRS